MRKLIPGMVLVGSLAACDTMQLAEYVPEEYAWAGSTVEPSGVVVVSDGSADSVVADSVTFLLYAVLEESGSAEGVLTILNDKHWRTIRMRSSWTDS